MSFLLIYPPTAKTAEPPAGIARLAGSLKSNGIPCFTSDLNLECMLDFLDHERLCDDTWSRRAIKSRYTHLAAFRSATIYQHPDRYQRAVKDLNRVLTCGARAFNCDITLANFTDPERSPLQSADLLEAADLFEDNPFFASFELHLRLLVEKYEPKFIGISFSYLSQALTGFAILGCIKQQYPDIMTIAGGGLISSWMSRPNWHNPFGSLIDHLVKGPGEQSLLALSGTAANEGIGRPDYTDFDFSRYLSPGPIVPYAASGGCYWKKCTFCPDQAENTRFFSNSSTRVFNELSELINRHNPVLLHFLDNAIPPQMLRQLAKIPPGVQWYGFVRAEQDLESLEFCRTLKSSGCVMLKIGVESGSQRVLDQMNKGIDIRRVARVLENLRKAGIATYIYLLFGTPHETEKEALLTMNFVKKHHDAITYLNLAIFNMPVCSPEATDISERFSTGDLSLYCNFNHPVGWDRKSVRTFLQTQFRKTPVISKTIQRDPPFFTSNHAPLFCS